MPGVIGVKFRSEVGMEIVRLDAAVAASIADDDEAIALRARSDPDAFAMLYIRRHETIYRYLRARCASDEDALELTSVTFERALAAMRRYGSRGGGVVAWLLRIARNAVIDQERRRKPLAAQRMTIELTSTDPTPEQAAIYAEERHELRRLLAELPQVQRDAIALRYANGLTAREIALVIGKSEDATQKLIGRALARLKEGYGE